MGCRDGIVILPDVGLSSEFNYFDEMEAKKNSMADVGSSIIVREICDAAGEFNVTKAAHKLGMIPSEYLDEVSAQLVRPWHRSGAETYLLDFLLSHKSGWKRRFVAKACVAYSGGQSLEEIHQKWLRRRSIVKAAGLRTPTLYSINKCVVIEEFLPYSIQEAMNTLGVGRVLLEYAMIYKGICDLGFMPVDIFSDLRFDGSALVVVDFGQDLGDPRPNSSTDNCVSQVEKVLAAYSADLDASTLLGIRRVLSPSIPRIS
jgi:hypothetical protein